MLKKILVVGVVMLSCAVATMAQDNNRRDDRGGDRGGDRRGFDPAQMQERIMQSYKERLEITDETEWKAIQPLVDKVLNAQRQGMSDRMRGFMGGPPRRSGDDRGGDRPNIFGGTTSPEVTALQRAIDSKASRSELKSAMEKVAAARKAKQAELERAQSDLRNVLTPRQEAIATLSGLL